MSNGSRIWHPFTQEALEPLPIRVVRAEGTHLYTEDGRRLIDAISSWWVNLHGHNHPAIVKAIAEQAARLDHVLLAGFTHEAAESLAAGLCEVLPAALGSIFFSDDGSTAVEVAIKMAVQYWQNAGQPQKTGIVALEHAYHGDTAGAMSVGADSPFTEPLRTLRFPVHRVHSAYCYRCPVGKTRAACAIDCAEQLAMGWDDSRLHEFRIGQKRFGKSDPSDRLMGMDPIGNERTTHLHMFLGKVKAKAMYACDFGDDWDHEIIVEKVLPPESGVAYPICVGGKLQGPPEDCGGIPGYYNLVEALRNPAHKDHDDLLDWIGGEFDPEAFSVEEVNRRLAPIQRWWAKSLK